MSLSINLPDSVSQITGPGGLPIITVKNNSATASIALQGAHILSFVPKGHEDLIWMSEDATFSRGKSLRGGIPICWPWFGAHDSNPQLPSHGHARTSDWKLISAVDISAQTTQLMFELVDTSDTRRFWDAATRVQYSVSIGTELSLTLETTTMGSSEITIGAALHTYFHIGDISQATVDGLSDCDYLDKVEGFARKHQNGLVRFNSEVDRIYLDTGNRCEIRDPVLKRRIIIHSKGSRSTVVWNPGQELAQNMGDLGLDGYRHMVCVETANASEYTVTLAPGVSHRLSATYRIADY